MALLPELSYLQAEQFDLCSHLFRHCHLLHKPFPFPSWAEPFGHRLLCYCVLLLLNARLWGHLDNEEIATNKVAQCGCLQRGMGFYTLTVLCA